LNRGRFLAGLWGRGRGFVGMPVAARLLYQCAGMPSTMGRGRRVWQG
jgi:hypothetical protein